MSTRTSKLVTTRRVGIATGLSAMFVLTGCGDEDVKTHAYSSIEECVAADVYDDGFCRTSFEEALAAHQALAPRYEDVKDCEADFGEGQCRPPEVVANNNNGGSSFIPFMWGYMLGNNAGATSAYSSPVYSSRSEGYRTLSGKPVSKSAFTTAGATTRASTFTKPSSPSTFSRGVSVTSRGGFGTTGRGLSMGS